MSDQIVGKKFISKATGEKVKITKVWKKGSPVGDRIMFDLKHLEKNLYGEYYLESLDMEQLKEYFKPLGNEK